MSEPSEQQISAVIETLVAHSISKLDIRQIGRLVVKAVLDAAPVAGSSPAGGDDELEREGRAFDKNIEAQLDSFEAAMAYRYDPEGTAYSQGRRDGYTAASSRLRNPSEEDVERAARVIQDYDLGGTSLPSVRPAYKQLARAALAAAADMLEGK